MFNFCVLAACLLSLPRSQADLRTSTRRYKPVIQVTEEIDINDITFTTSVPEFQRSSSQKTANYYNGIKLEGVGKGGHGRLSGASPSVFPHVYKDSYGAAVPIEKIYATGQPLLVPVAKYKPNKIFKVSDGQKTVPYRAKGQDKSKGSPFNPPATYTGPEVPKHFLANVAPFSSQPTRASTYLTQDNNHFIPSPTFSPTVLAQLPNENSFSEHPDVTSFTTQKLSNWSKPTKKPSHTKNPKRILHNHRLTEIATEDFPTSSEKPEENLSSSTLYKESPQQSESFLSEISTLHNGGTSANNLDGVTDSLDLKTGERVEFQMYGMDGPQSYKFGFDTGKGHNRHFRFEERDNTGKVKGHYGYLDEDGKMRIMKYEADPVTGFHAGPVEFSPDDN